MTTSARGPADNRPPKVPCSRQRRRPADGAWRSQVPEIVRASRNAQGLSAWVEDRTVLAVIAALLSGGNTS